MKTEAERKDLYRQLCLDHKITQLFMQDWWLDATGPWDTSFALRNDRIIGAMPFALKRKWGLRMIGMPAMTHHTRIWMDKPEGISDHKWLTREKQIIFSLIEHLPPFSFFSMVFDEGSFDNWLPFHWKDFRQEMRYTFIIEHADVSGESATNRNIRRNIRDAGDQLIIHSEVAPKDFYAITGQTYKRQKMKTPFSFEFFSALDNTITAHQAGIKLGAYKNGSLLSVAYLLWDRERAYYFIAGDSEQGRKSGAGIYLCNEALRIAFEEKNVAAFDFCGSMIEPITEIRRQFGAKAVPLMKIVKTNNRLLDIAYKLTH